MKKAETHEREKERLKALEALNILDTVAEQEFDDIALLASEICNTPIALISFVDDKRQWFKSRLGLEVTETPKDVAFCAHAILQSNILEIRDSTADARFANNPLVTEAPFVKFYAGMPILDPVHSLPLGTLCVIDHAVRNLDENQKKSLRALSRQITRLLSDRLKLQRVTHDKLLNEIIFKTMTEGLVIQGESGAIEEFNPEALKILGLSEDQLLGRTSMDPRWKSVKDDGTPFPGEEHPSMVALRSGKEVRDTLMGLTLPDGREKWIKINAVPFVMDGKNKVSVTFADVSEILKTHKSLMKAEKELKEAQEIARIGSWKYDLRSGNQVWTSEHYRIFEIDEPQSQSELYRLYRERIHPDDLPELDRIVDRAIKFGEDFVYNHRVSLDGGTRIKHVRGIGRVTKDNDGNPIYISGTCQDLTDLVALQEQYQFILSSLAIGIWKFNPTTQDLQWDQSLYNLYELNPKDFSGHYQAWESSLSPDAKQRAVEELGLALSGEKDFDTTFEIITKGGRRKYIGGKGVVIRNPQGRPIMMYGINWDKSSEHLAQMQIENSKRLLQSIIDASPSSIFVKNLDGRYLVCNNSLSELFGKSVHEILGKDLYELYPQHVADSMTANDQQVISSGRSKTFEELIPCGDELRWHLVSLFPINNDSGGLIGVGGILTDLHDEKLSQERHQQELAVERAKSAHSAKLASLGEMAAGVAHEINNPLALIMGSISLLRKHRNDEARHESKIDVIAKSTERIAKIVSGLRKFSRSSSSQIFKIEKLSLIVSEAMVLTESKARRYSTPITVDLAPDIEILCDQVEIEQVLVNLINNGIDAVQNLEQRWIKIKGFEDSNQIVIQVIDSGKSPSPEIESKLFEPFFTTKAVGEGTGLGLSISKGILDNHKASFGLNRQVDNTCFEIRFANPARHGANNGA